MGVKVQFINRVVAILILFWSLLLGVIVFIFIFENYHYADTLAKHEAVISVKKDLAYRSWVASHGGVYVPITKNTPPNPYLAHIKNRDVNTTTGQQLTLMNGAYTLSQMMSDYSNLYGTKGHITSRILMNPKNKPDDWEEKALQTIEVTRKPVYEKNNIAGEEYFRYMNPMITEEGCLKCHAFQGYKVGDIRGGVSISLPMKPFYSKAFSQSSINALMIFIIYVIGVIAIFFGRKKAKETLEGKIQDYEQHIFSLVNIIETRDKYTAGHTQRVAEYSVLIAEEMGFNEDKIDDLYRACMLHDIGKISTPDSILLKPGKLTKLEYKIIQNHVISSYEILKDVDIYKGIAEIVRHHHERCDGTGYPQGLKCDEIPILSQIMTVSDAFDAMTTNRIYKAKKTVQQALDELVELSGKQFNKEIVEIACIALKDVKPEQDISQRPKSQVEQERFSYFYKDQITNIYNKDYLEFILSGDYIDKEQYNCVNIIYLHNFTSYNKEFGWTEGDVMLKNIAQEIDEFNKDSLVFRANGDDFILLNKEHYDISELIKKLNKILENTQISLSNTHLDAKDLDLESIKKLIEIS